MFLHQEFAPQVVLRIQQAYREFELLRDEMFDRTQAHSNAIGTKQYRVGENVFRFERVSRIFFRPPFEWSVRIGEIVHNLRAALDNLACAMAVEHSRAECEHTEFPIFDSPATFAAVRRRQRGGVSTDPIRALHPDAQAVIEGLQPYHSGDPQQDPLWLLYNLSNIDKHRLFHLSIWALAAGSFHVEAGPGAEVIEQGFMHYLGAVAFDTPLAYAVIRYTDTNAKVKVDDRYTFDVAFEERNVVAAEQFVRDVLERLICYVAAVVEVFERFAPPTIYVSVSEPEEVDPDDPYWHQLSD
jgi:hypothetical protein